MDLNDRLKQLEQYITNPSFLDQTGSGEVKYYIFDYAPEHEAVVNDCVKRIADGVNQKDKQLRIKFFDVYDLIIDRLEEKKYLGKCFKIEKEKGAKGLANAVKSVIHIESKETNNYLVSYIDSHTEKGRDIVVLAGIGKAFPLIRVRELLSSFNNIYSKCPIILLLPGEYDGRHITAFNRLKKERT